MAPQVSRRPAAVVALAHAVAAVVLGTSALAQEPPRFPATTEVVRIDAVVVDKAGRPVTGLTVADFTVEEDGKPRPIATFEPIVVRSAAEPPEPKSPPSVSVSAPRAIEAQEGRALLIYFDDIHVSPPGAEWVRHNLGPFLQSEVRPGDVVTIVAPHGNFWWTARTPWEHAQLPAVVARLKGQYNRNPFKDEKSDWLVMQDLEYGQKIRDESHTATDTYSLAREAQYGMALQRIERTINGLERAIASLEGFRGRKSIVIYSEGFILSPRAVHREYYDRTVDQCRRANVALFVADPRGLRTGRPAAEDPTAGGTVNISGGLLEAETAGSGYIAIATGGRVFFENDATEAVAHVLEESKAYYLIGFAPGEGRPGERKVGVRVRREGLRVRARTRYYWGDPLRPGTADPAPVAALRAMSDRTDVPFEVRAATGATTGAGPAPVRLELRLLPAGTGERKLKLLIEARPLAKDDLVHDAADLTVPASDVPQAVERELRLSPGVWQARVVLTDQGTGAVGSVLHTFEVPGGPSGGSGNLRAPAPPLVPSTARRDASHAQAAAPAISPTISSRAREPELPAGWYRAGDRPTEYEVGIDPTGGRNGGACGFIAGRGERPAGYGTLMQAIAADAYRGRRLRFSAHVKAAGVGGWAGLWMRIDGRSKSPSEPPATLGFDNMQGRPIKGTLDWGRYEIVLDVPAEAHVIGFGIVLSGPGRAWLDGLQFETVGADVARTDTMVLPKRPNLRFED